MTIVYNIVDEKSELKQSEFCSIFMALVANKCQNFLFICNI